MILKVKWVYKMALKTIGIIICFWLLFVVLFNSIGYSKEVCELPNHRFVVFSDSKKSCDYLANDDHLSSLTKLDIELRLEKDESGKDIAACNKEYMDYWQKQFRNWSRADKRFILNRLKTIYEEIGSVTPNVLPDTLYLIRATGRQEFKAFYTYKKAIICSYAIRLSSTYMPGIFISIMNSIFTHELFHVYTNCHPEKIEGLYNLIGFEKIDEIKLENSLSERLIHNPDDKVDWYKIRLTDTLANQEKDYCLLILSKYSKWIGYIDFPGRISVLIVYLDPQKLHQIVYDGATWKSSLDTYQQPILKNQKDFFDFKKKVGLSGEISPEEIVGHLFVDLIRLASNKKYLHEKPEDYKLLLKKLRDALK
jgi:hypothetical protein